MTHFYDDIDFSYDQYWQDRQYEHQCEVTALKKLLGGSKFRHIADIGGGFGRLSKILAKYAKSVTLVEPAQKQRLLARKYLPENIEIKAGLSDKTGLPAGSCDLVVMIRVMHHLPEPETSIAEISRILAPKGRLVLEFANSANFKARIRSFLAGQPILPIPLDRRSNLNIKNKTIPFVNHHPLNVFKMLKRQEFKIKEVLSVSNFRVPILKKILPIALLNYLESITQKPLSRVYLGPSIFVLAEKTLPAGRQVDTN